MQIAHFLWQLELVLLLLGIDPFPSKHVGVFFLSGQTSPKESYYEIVSPTFAGGSYVRYRKTPEPQGLLGRYVEAAAVT